MNKKPFKVLSSIALTAVLGLSFGAGTQSAYAETPANKTATSPVDDHLIPEERLADALKTWVIDSSASEKETKKAVEKYVENKRVKILGKKYQMGINLRKKHLIFKESERCESRHERKIR